MTCANASTGVGLYLPIEIEGRRSKNVLTTAAIYEEPSAQVLSHSYRRMIDSIHDPIACSSCRRSNGQCVHRGLERLQSRSSEQAGLEISEENKDDEGYTYRGVQSMVDVGECEVWNQWQYATCRDCVSCHSSMKGLLHTEEVGHSHGDTRPEGIASARLINLKLKVHHKLIESAYKHWAWRHK